MRRGSHLCAIKAAGRQLHVCVCTGCSGNRENTPEPGSPLLWNTSTQHDGALLSFPLSLRVWPMPRSTGHSELQRGRRAQRKSREKDRTCSCHVTSRHVMLVRSNGSMQGFWRMQGASGGGGPELLVVDQSSSLFPQPPSRSTWHPECVPSANVGGYRGWRQCLQWHPLPCTQLGRC